MSARAAKTAAASKMAALSWDGLRELCKGPLLLSPDSLKNGPSSSYARLRLSGGVSKNTDLRSFINFPKAQNVGF